MAKINLLNKKLPTLIGILVLVLGVAGGVLLVKNRQLLTPKAGPTDQAPQNVTISNLQTDAFTVSFTTTTETPAYLLAGPDSDLSIEGSNYFLDNRDQLSGSLTSFQTHYITVANGRSQRESNFNIQSDQKYYFKIGLGDPSGSKQLFDNLGKPYEAKTASQSIISPADIISGTVLDQSGQKITGAITYLNLPAATVLSDQTKEGRFVIPINTAYALNLNESAPYDPQATTMEIFIQDARLSSTVKTLTGIKNLPDITIGENYDFTTDASSLPTDAPSTGKAEPTLPPKISLTPTIRPVGSGFNTTSQTGITPQPTVPFTSTALTIANPAYDDEKLAAVRPEFRGTGPANELISIQIESDLITASVTVGGNGVWTYTPPQNLTAGEHTITASYFKDNGDEETITRDFTIAAADGESTELPSFTSTPSASISPTVPPSPTPTEAIRSSMPSTESGVPDSGIITPTLFLSLFGLMFFSLAIKLVKIN